ncbi:MAG: CBS domain-containing protein [Anaerolineae bacterium]|nr:CBS domain-containing protein [Anaerolineae bacterium]
MRVFLADDQPQVRSALRLLLDQEPEFEVVGEAASTSYIVEKMQETQPDLLLLDWELPSLSTTDLLSNLRTTYPNLIVIALSGQLEAHQAALAAGVDAFISKGHPPEQLLNTLHLINWGQDGRIRQALVKDWMTSSVVTISPDPNLFQAHHLMKAHKIRRLPVVKDNRLVGIITIGDIEQAKAPPEAKASDKANPNLWALNNLVAELTVAQIMTPDPVTVFADNTTAEAAQLMQINGISSLPVVSEHQAVIGIITESNIFQMVVQGWNITRHI